MVVLKFVGAKRERTAVSCLECRRRKKRCEATKPSCLGCIKRGVICEYHDNRRSKLTIKCNAMKQPKSSNKELVCVNEITAGGSPSWQFGAHVEPIVPAFSLYDANMDIDMEILSLVIIESVDMTQFKRSNDMTIKYFISCYDLVKPLTMCSKLLAMTLSVWILQINNEFYQSVKFYDESLQLLKEFELNMMCQLARKEWNEDDLIVYVVCLIIQLMLSGKINDVSLWKLNFEKIFKCLSQIGLTTLKRMIVKDYNKKLFEWSVGCFFYHDIFKQVKVTQDKVLGPVFPRQDYLQILDGNEKRSLSGDGDNEMISSLCKNLHHMLGEINTVYDIFTIKLKRLIDQYLYQIEPKMKDICNRNGGSDDCDEMTAYISGEEYIAYEEIRCGFHLWVQEKIRELEANVENSEIHYSNMNILSEEAVVYFEIVKLTVMLYMQFKLNDLSANNYEIKQLILRIFKKFRYLLHHEKFHSRLKFTLLILGANVYEERDKILMKFFYVKLLETESAETGGNGSKGEIRDSSIKEIWKIIQEFWRLNPNGVSSRLWQNIINRYDWNVCVI